MRIYDELTISVKKGNMNISGLKVSIGWLYCRKYDMIFNRC